MRRRSVLRAIGVGIAGSALAGCQRRPPAGDCPPLAVEPNYRGFLDGVSNYDHTCDLRDQDTVTVQVGVAGNIDYFKFGPPAVAVSPGTEVRWEWTGRGGAHNVVAQQGTFDSGEPVDEEGNAFSYTFERPAVYKYVCEPHVSQAMKGAVFVALNEG